MKKFNELYDISSTIIEHYQDFTNSTIYQDSFTMYNSMLNLLRRLVMKEYDLVHSMTLDEIDICLNIASLEENQRNIRVITRIKNKLLNGKDVLQQNSICSNELEIKSLPSDLKYSISDAILSMLDIEVIKSIKNKINTLKPTCKQDIYFTKKLKEELKVSKIDILYLISVAEIITLYHTDNIDKIPKIDINKIQNKILSFRNPNYNDLIRNTIALYVKEIIDALSNTTKLKNNPEQVFMYLLTLTRLEIAISYLDLNTLNIIYDYCNHITNSNNNPSMTKTKSLIKEKIDKTK